MSERGFTTLCTGAAWQPQKVSRTREDSPFQVDARNSRIPGTERAASAA